MSNFIIRQQGASSVVADNIWELRLGAGSLLLGVLAGAVGGALVGVHLGKRGEAHPRPDIKAWPVNVAHRGGADIVPENTIEGFREGLDAGAGVLELDVHMTADGHLVVIHNETVDDTTDGCGPVREKTLAEIKRLDAAYRFSTDGGKSFPRRGKGVKVPTLGEVYGEFEDVPINVEIKDKNRPGIEEAVWQTIRDAGAEERTLVVAEDLGTIRRFREASGGRVATAASRFELVFFDLLRRLRLGGLSKPAYQALQGPEFYPLRIRAVTPDFVRAAGKLGLRVDVWTINTEERMRRLLALGVDGIMTDRPDILTGILKGSGGAP